MVDIRLKNNDNINSIISRLCTALSNRPADDGSCKFGRQLLTVIFVPCRDGESHCPVECTKYSDFASVLSVIPKLAYRCSTNIPKSSLHGIV